MPDPAPPALSVRFRGVRGSIPSPGFQTARYGGNTSCVELRAGESILVLDAGSGLRNLGTDLTKEFGFRPINADVLISHTHWDHIQGLPFFTPLYSPQNNIRIISANSDAAVLEQALRNQMQPLHFPVGLDDMPGLAGLGYLNAHLTSVRDFQIERIALNHPGGCAGLRISSNGATVAYLPDHEPHRHLRKGESGAQLEIRREAIMRFVSGVDLLILDTQYTEAEYHHHIGWGHGCLTDSVALALDAGISRLLLFHHDPWHTDEQIDEMVKEARKLAENESLSIEAAAEGQSLELPAKTSGHETRHPFGVGAAPSILTSAARRKISFPLVARA